MDVEILNKNERPLLHRTEIDAKVFFTGATPSRIELRKSLAGKLHAEENKIIINKIKTNYGNENAEINAFVYNDEEHIKKLVNRNVIMRHLTKEEHKAEMEKIRAAKQAAAPTAGAKKK